MNEVNYRIDDVTSCGNQHDLHGLAAKIMYYPANMDTRREER